MKILLILFLLLCGCENNMQIKYNNNLINKEDYNYIHDKLNNIEYKEDKLDIPFDNTLTVFNNDELDIYNISENGIRYKKDGKEYYGNTDTKEILDYLNKKYPNNNFYNILKSNQYEKDDNDLYIKLDNSNNYYIIYLKEEISNFSLSNSKILYTEKQINKNKIVIEYKDNLNIKFNNKYVSVKVNTKDIK